MDKNKKVLVISVIGILVLILGLVGLTYAWFSSSIEGSGANFNVTTATVGPLTYTGTEITANGVLPGWISEDATLTVNGTVTGNEAVEYYCSIENTGEVTDVEYRISSDGEENSTTGTWTSIEVNPIVTGSISSTNESDEYKLAIRFKETGEDQNSQQNKTLSVNVVCFVGEEDESLYERILADNPNKTTRPSFDTIYTESNNGDTIYEETYTQDEREYTTYYFAGAVTNNYVKFTGVDGSEMWWRIIRINEDNSVRLLYYGTNSSGANMFSSTSTFNTTDTISIYVGYEYATDTQHGTGTNSEIKTYLEEWYTSNLVSYDTYISRTAIYCNDRTVGSGTWSATGTTFNYAARTRLQTNKAPTFACANAADKFTGSTVTGNGRLEEKPIGLITADEVAYAGGVWNTGNTSYYISENATGANYWWTMAPYYWYTEDAGGFVVGGSTNTGSLLSSGVNVEFGVRPVISLKSCVNWSNGDGTSDSPYEVTVDNTCANAEN